MSSFFAKDDNEGWTARNHDDTLDATRPIQVHEFNGNYYLFATDHPNGKEWGWHAPAKYHGDHSDKFGRYLKYDLWRGEKGQRR